MKLTKTIPVAIVTVLFSAGTIFYTNNEESSHTESTDCGLSTSQACTSLKSIEQPTPAVVETHQEEAPQQTVVQQKPVVQEAPAPVAAPTLTLQEQATQFLSSNGQSNYSIACFIKLMDLTGEMSSYEDRYTYIMNRYIGICGALAKYEQSKRY